MESLVALLIPLIILAFLRSLAHQWFPWAMRPAEKIVSTVWRTFWNIVWKNPVRAWGTFNVLWIWLLAATVLVTASSVVSGCGDMASMFILWLLVVGSWWGLRWWSRWRFCPHRLPHRRRRD